MNTASFKIEKNYIKKFLQTFLFTFCYFAQVKVHALEIDLSRRQTAFDKIENVRMPASLPPESEADRDTELFETLKKVVNPVDISEEIVIVQTENGYVPSVVHLQKGKAYKIHLVNLDLKNKNTSFLMDSFSQVHNTVYGEMKTFTFEPKVDGVYSYQSPETGFTGKVVIVPEVKRSVASESVTKKVKKLKPVIQEKETEQKVEKENLQLSTQPEAETTETLH